MTAWPPPWSGPPRGGFGIPDPQLRVSDAERAQVADALSRHFAEGRLDAQEHDERLQRAMAAKTRADLAGLLSDLPPPVPEPAPVELRRRRGGFTLLLVTTAIIMAAFTSALWAWHFPWLLFALVFFLVWRRAHRGWHRHGPWGWHGAVPPRGTGGGPPYWVYGSRRRWWV